MLFSTSATRQTSCESKQSEQTVSTNVGTMSRQVSPFSNESTETGATRLPESAIAGPTNHKVRRNLINALGAEAGLDLHYDWESDDDISGNVASRDCWPGFNTQRLNTHTLAAEASLDLHLDWEEEDVPSNTAPRATAPRGCAPRPKYGSVGGFESELAENLGFA